MTTDTPTPQGAPAPFSVERHGSGWAIYRGRDHQHHGCNLGHLTECDEKLPALIEASLNASIAADRASRAEPVARVLYADEPETVDVGFVDWIAGKALARGTLLYAAPVAPASAASSPMVAPTETTDAVAVEGGREAQIRAQRAKAYAMLDYGRGRSVWIDANLCIDLCDAALPSTLKAAPTGELELVPHPSDKEIRRIAKTVRAPEPAASPDVAPGAVHDRDVNAALNIRRRGLATLGEGAVS